MELDNQNTKRTYIQLLVEILQKKKSILNQLMLLTEQQEVIIVSDKMNDEDFIQLVNQKEECIKNLTKLDDGFEKLYVSVNDELVINKDKYVGEINTLKELIVNITDISVNLQALEKRNKSKMELYFTKKRKEIKSSRISNQTVANYYKTMTKQHENESFFYDKKK